MRIKEYIIMLADKLHAAEDEQARADGITVTRTGLTGRMYRDSRFKVDDGTGDDPDLDGVL